MGKDCGVLSITGWSQLPVCENLTKLNRNCDLAAMVCSYNLMHVYQHIQAQHGPAPGSWLLGFYH
jgi:hypothetical protein